MASKPKWFAVPLGFAVLLSVCLIVRWLPLAIERAQTAFGFGQVIGGNILLVLKSMLRGGVAFIITIPAVPLLPPIEWKQALLVSIGAVVAETVVEVGLSTVIGAEAGQSIQLAATAMAYATVLLVSGVVLRGRSRMSSREHH